MRVSDTIDIEGDDTTQLAITEPDASDSPPKAKILDLSSDAKWTNENLPNEQKRDGKRLGFWHDVLVHRYDYEVGRMNNLKSQSTFILGAVGLVITLGVTLFTADRFSLSYVYQLPTILISLSVAFLILAAYYALRVFFRVNRWGYCLAYPSDGHIFGGLANPYYSPADLNPDLVKIIERNSKNNDGTVSIMWKGQVSFIIGIILTFIVGAMLLYICLTHDGSDAVINAANVTINVVNTSVLPTQNFFSSGI